MNIGQIENSKQAEYLNQIKNVGMGIIFGQVEVDDFINTFEPFIDYMNTPSEYLETLKEVSYMIYNKDCSPDDLLFKMGKHVPQIEYKEEFLSYDEDYNENYDEEDIYNEEAECIELTDEIHQLLKKLL